ncbi:hypothetical protein [Caballeronia grimmiae]|uniref:Uncharacterized protein n=1 Tax=Caballeronia grimmiae TaxID=1071679 RepID=A0A069NAE0_9BURK|nr:hypothetical protein [Caballeronia grimmiae]KDR24619.1 hypothetical protein BG57_05250 [Caballeronia grimmiae]
MAGDLFDDGWQTWTPSQAKSMFMAGLVDDFFCTRVQDHWCLIFMVVGGKDKERFFALRGAREQDKRKYRRFKSLDAAVNAASEVGFDCRSIGPHNITAKPIKRAYDELAERMGDLLRNERKPRQGRPQGGEAQP